jgi:alkylation response protein AidB-like acyl-CoA dehydrogenase
MATSGAMNEASGEERGGASETFRLEVRAWLAQNFPRALVGANPLAILTRPEEAAAEPERAHWLRAVVERGFGVPTWPRRYGGAGLDRAEAQVLAEEMMRVGAFNPVVGNGPMMLGPTLLEFGTEAQKDRYLPPIARAESVWCQGFSEPGAGSDLAALKMRCEDRGDHWLVNGQKIWTSFANHSDWCFCLVRTDFSVKQAGISLLLIEMNSPGIEVRPITLISGITHFCEVFFTDVAVPKENLVGEVNRGWHIAKRLLEHERAGLSSVRRGVIDLPDLARRYVGVDADGRVADPDLRARLVQHLMRARTYALTLKRVAEESAARSRSGQAVSVLKNLGSGVEQARAELAVEILGHQGVGWEGEGYTREEIEVTRALLYSKAFTIYGGSQEIQSNIIAKRVLGLPDLR